MVLSRDAYNVGSVVATGGLTVHDLRLSIATEGVSPEHVNVFLHDSLVELCRSSMLEWYFEPDYGNAAPIKPASFGEKEFEVHWFRCFPSNISDSDFPDSDHPTLFLEPNNKLFTELNNTVYSDYG